MSDPNDRYVAIARTVAWSIVKRRAGYRDQVPDLIQEALLAICVEIRNGIPAEADLYRAASTACSRWFRSDRTHGILGGNNSEVRAVVVSTETPIGDGEITLGDTLTTERRPDVDLEERDTREAVAREARATIGGQRRYGIEGRAAIVHLRWLAKAPATFEEVSEAAGFKARTDRSRGSGASAHVWKIERRMMASLRDRLLAAGIVESSGGQQVLKLETR